MSAAGIHARLGSAWPAVLAQLGIDENFLRLKKAGPCPACGGTDRYTFDNRRGRGDFICRGCGAGDGFTLLQRVYGWEFREACRRVAAAAGLATDVALRDSRPASSGGAKPTLAQPTRRVLEILRDTCATEDAQDAIAYLLSRRLWPLPPRCNLRAHASCEYWHEGQRVGRFSALVAEVRDVQGELVSAHVTYLAGGRKLEPYPARKLLSPLTGRIGCAARLLPVAVDTLGVAEGIETALAAHRLHGLPTWAALNAGLLAKFEPPETVRALLVFADRDAAGLEAAALLKKRLQGRVRVELRVPRPPAKDFADVLAERAA